jgi:hypothetical protein
VTYVAHEATLKYCFGTDSTSTPYKQLVLGMTCDRYCIEALSARTTVFSELRFCNANALTVTRASAPRTEHLLVTV